MTPPLSLDTMAFDTRWWEREQKKKGGMRGVGGGGGTRKGVGLAEYSEIWSAAVQKWMQPLDG